MLLFESAFSDDADDASDDDDACDGAGDAWHCLPAAALFGEPAGELARIATEVLTVASSSSRARFARL